MFGRQGREKYIRVVKGENDVFYLQSLQMFFPFSSAKHQVFQHCLCPEGVCLGRDYLGHVAWVMLLWAPPGHSGSAAQALCVLCFGSVLAFLLRSLRN